MGADGHGEFEVRRDAWHIVFSPNDNDLVAYGVRENGGANIVLHNITSEESRSILPRNIATKFSQIYYNFQWSWDGEYIAFKARPKEGRMVLAVAGTNKDKPFYQELGPLDGPKRICFRPESNAVYVSRRMGSDRSRRVYLVDPFADFESDPEYQLMPEQPVALDNQPCDWSPDGKRLLMVSRAIEEPKSTPRVRDDFGVERERPVLILD